MMRSTLAEGGQKTTLTDQAYAVIKQSIICLGMPPGSSFTEAQLALELGLSKTPVREALARLEREGFVQVTARCGYSVSPVTLKDVRDLFGLRILLEGEAASLAASRASDASQLRVLEEAARTGYAHDDPASITHFLESNTRFHVTLARAADNNRLVRVLEQVLDQLDRLFYLGLAQTPRSDQLTQEHQELVTAVISGDAARARDVAIAQIRASQNMVIEALLSSEALLSTNIAATPFSRSALTVPGAEKEAS